MKDFIRVFLDSSDYSTLSNPKSKSSELEDISNSLRALKESGAVRYYFSSTIICEIAPTRVDYGESAARRFQTLYEFCGRNALIWHEDLIKSEISNALGIASRWSGPYSDSGDWLPLDAMAVDFNIFEGADRETRRSIQRKFRNELKRGGLPSDLRDLPFPDAVKLAVAHAVASDGKGLKIRDAIAAAFRDPRHFLSHLLRDSAQCLAFSEILRDSARSMMRAVETTMSAAEEVRKTALNADSIRRDEWDEIAERAVVNIFANLANYFHKNSPAYNISFEEIRLACPGLFSLINTAYDVWWKSMVATPRQPSDSDYADALHSSYAPYVDIFRADRAMASHVTASVERAGTAVVGRLKDLPHAINATLQRMNERI